MENGKYQLGDTWSSDFDYEGMLQAARTIQPTFSYRTLVTKITKLYDSLVDVNYHDLAKLAWSIKITLRQSKEVTDEILLMYKELNDKAEEYFA